MKVLSTLLCAATFLLFGSYAGLAQDKSTASKESQQVQQESKTNNGNNKTAKVSTDTVRRKVESYETGP